LGRVVGFPGPSTGLVNLYLASSISWVFEGLAFVVLLLGLLKIGKIYRKSPVSLVDLV